MNQTNPKPEQERLARLEKELEILKNMADQIQRRLDKAGKSEA